MMATFSSAPKDGTRVLMWIMPTRIWMWKDGRWMDDDYPLNTAWPPHWQLPPPPSEHHQREGSSNG